MKSETQKITSADLRKYRTELPNLYDDAGLNVYEFRLLAHYVRVGTTWESVRTTAEKCGMSHPMVIKARRSLEEKGFIKTHEESIPTGKAIIIEIVDRWAENYTKYSGHTVSQVVTQFTEGGHTVSRGGHTVELKKEPIKKEHIKNDSEYSPAAVYLLDAIGAKRLNPKQRETIESLEAEYPMEAIQKAIDWCANNGMAVGRAVNALPKTVSKIAQEKTNGNGRTAPPIKVTPGQEKE